MDRILHYKPADLTLPAGATASRLRLSRTQLEELIRHAGGLDRVSAERSAFRAVPVQTRLEGQLTDRIRSAFDPAGILVPARPPRHGAGP